MLEIFQQGLIFRFSYMESVKKQNYVVASHAALCFMSLSRRAFKLNPQTS